MLSQSQRAALTAQLRRDRAATATATAVIPRRDAAMMTPPASFGQEQLWFIDRFAPRQAIYNIPCVISIRGPLDAGALGEALRRLMERHEALRTRLVTSHDGRPVQVIDPPGPVAMAVEDFTGFEPAKQVPRAREFIHAEAMRPFQLGEGPLLRTCLLRLASGEHLLAIVVHHAVFDGWSAGVFLRDLAALYSSEVTGAPCELPELPIQFADYALWERNRIAGGVLAELAGYWQEVLDGFETVRFPVDRPRPVVDDFSGGLAERTADAELLTALRDLSRREGTTVFAALLAALFGLLHRYTGQHDLVVGTVSANRGRAELAPLIGFLVNALPIRCDLSGDPSFRALLGRVKHAAIGAFAHQDLPFGKLVEAVGVERDASRAPIFQIALTYAEREAAAVLGADGVEFAASELVLGIDAAKFDLTFAVEARRDGLWIECSYKTALFDAATVKRLLTHLETLLRGAVADPSARLSELPLLSAAELRAELCDWNDTAAEVPPGCVHERFEAQVARTPDAVAAEFEDQRVSYTDLNRRANQIARRLRDLGVGPEALVGVSMHVGLRRLAALLGIMKAGGGYVPLDPALPQQRLSFMIADTAMTVILTDSASAGGVPDTSAIVVSLDGEWDRLGGMADTNLHDTGVKAANAAYVLYTSGSTGQPKGVVVEHRNVVNLVHGMIRQWGIGPGSAVLQFASVTFDVSVMDMFMPLVGGARVVLAQPDTLRSPPGLAALIRDARITFACLPPAVLDLLPPDHEYPDLRVLMAAGEELPGHVARRWLRPGLRLVNGYGPTEATVIAAYAELDAAAVRHGCPVGFPTQPNYRCYVLDQWLNPVPSGVTGELYIGGAGVARGYLNRPGLTGQRFIADPFVPGARLYKTGDLVRRRPDGSIVFGGRIDDQVKIRGIRIELGEIENALVAHADIAQAVVTVLVSPAGEKELAAYLRPAAAGGGALSEQEIRAHLAGLLPAAMIPAHLIAVGTFPLNASGKVDKRALPPPGSRAPSATDRVPPATVLEAMLADTYATVLGVHEVGATDGFFDLGGNSLQAMRLVGALDAELDVDVGAAAVFLAPTPRRLAALLCEEHGFADEALDALNGEI